MAVEQVKSWMTFLGWSNGGAPGAVKTQYGGTVVARYGDATWVKDVEDACQKVERERIVAEITERQRLGFMEPSEVTVRRMRTEDWPERQ